jgi:lysophospholipase L1-like esterase
MLNDAYTSGDGVHLNSNGYKKWGEEMAKYLW